LLKARLRHSRKATRENGRECGIIVAGLGEDRHAYVLADCSSKGDSPAPVGEDRRHAMRGAVHRSYAQKLVEAGMEQIVA
jgi:phage terminase large subunit-like protein